MKEKSPADVGPSVPGPRSNRDRTEATRAALLDAARALFVRQGYGDTSTPEVVSAAGITRGALYHHFADKRDLFRAVLAREMQAVGEEIRTASPQHLAPRAALLAGAQAYLDAMAVPGRTRLLLVDGPAVLGAAEIEALESPHGPATLAEGLIAAWQEGADALPQGAALAARVSLLSAAFDRAALDLERGADPAAVRSAIAWLVQGAAAAG